MISSLFAWTRKSAEILLGAHTGDTILLIAVNGIAAFLSLVLQLIAIRSLPTGEYASFVLTLGIGNVAFALAAAIQPIAAIRLSDVDGILPPRPLKLAAISGVLLLILWTPLASRIGGALALAVLLQ